MNQHSASASHDAVGRARVQPTGSLEPDDRCDGIQPGDPCAVVIMGATGDLTARKLIPALFTLYRNGGLPDRFAVVGCGRTEWDDDKLRRKVGEGLHAAAGDDRQSLQSFLARLHYRRIDYQEPDTYRSLSEYLKDIDDRYGTRGNRVFYLALPPSLYRPVAQMIGKAQMSREQTNSIGWSRLVVEKPFGHDLESAIDLDRAIHQHFDEHQVFRIDHYLAKETVQNILVFRFANAIFEPIWNRRYIDHVSITASETLGVEHRAGYYEQSGVLRDMFQNHMMQLLALTAMEPPSRFMADPVRDERVKVFRALRPFPTGDLQNFLALGQYRRGRIGDRPVSAYREEPDVDPDSATPTYARMKVYLDNWRWQGVPFMLTSGKRLAEKRTEIGVQFKEVPHSMFRSVFGETITTNRLILGIYPEEKITLTFQTKQPGGQVCLRPVKMDFFYHHDGNRAKVLDAYEKALLDCMLGDQMLFWRQDAVELCWSFLTPILDQCETCEDPRAILHYYDAGSWGPKAAQSLWTHPNDWGIP